MRVGTYTCANFCARAVFTPKEIKCFTMRSSPA